MTQITTELPVVNLGQVIRDCQLRVATAYATKGDSHALVALACSSVALQAYVEAGSLTPTALDKLNETATNLGLRSRLGDRFVDIALDAGPSLYDRFADEWLRMTRPKLVGAA